MAANPYYIQPADFSQGFKGLMQGFAKRGEFEREKAKSTANLKMREDVFSLMKEGTPEEIQEFVVKNPKAKGVFDEVIGITNDITKQDKVQTALNILTGEDPTEALLKHTEVIDQQGGDASQTIETIKQSATNPEVARKGAMKILAAYAPDKLKAFQSLAGEKTPAIKEYEYGLIHPDFVSAAGEEGSLLADFTPDQLGEMATTLSQTGEFPFKGRSASVRKANAKIKKLSLQQQKEQGITDIQARFSQEDIKGMTKDINAQQKKVGSMRSFAKNIDKQVSKLEKVGKKLKTYKNRLANVAKNKILEKVGDADRAVVKLLMGELEEEIGKLASGATESVAALTDAGREKWRKIFDPDLSFKEMMQVVYESKEVAHMRIESMNESIAESKKIRAGTSRTKKKTLPTAPDGTIRKNKSGLRQKKVGGKWENI